MAERLRDLSQPIDVTLLDATVDKAYHGVGSKERTAADQILRELQSNPDTWLQVVHILQNTRNLNTKFFGLQVLKHEWPARWKTFVPDLVSAAKSNEIICENCMAILKLHSEEVFDFSSGELTQQKIKELKQSLNSYDCNCTDASLDTRTACSDLVQ